MNLLLYLFFFLLLALLTLVSYVERVYTEMGKFLSRQFQENIDSFELRVEPALRTGREYVIQAIAVLVQSITAAIALLLGYAIFARNWDAASLAEISLTIVLVVLIFNRLLPFVLFSRTKGEWLVPLAPVLRALMYLLSPFTLLLSFCLSVVALAEKDEPKVAEHPFEAVEALIEAGQDEGILEESDRALIQSVVEFGYKTVREVMTPRPKIVALPATANVEQFVELTSTRPYSRVPVYEGSIDHVTGIVLAHDVFQIRDTEARTMTLDQLKRPAYFVPETKLVQELMREMQRENQQLAMVVDEYGGLVGLVTMEDLVEEIVGDIGDEHDAKSDVVKESEHSYVVSGIMEVDRLEELFGIRPESRDATTVAGLLSELVGHIPSVGEVIEHEGLRFEVLESSDRRTERLRVSARPRAVPRAVETPAPNSGKI